ncbi:MAG: hypothetical protein IKB01_11790 [Lachnospiraceae bacterium]|nr:hypothetical protein [Lachnospiraceae bacterium]
MFPLINKRETGVNLRRIMDMRGITPKEFTPDVLTNYLEQIRQTTKFTKWFFGHYHDNKNVNAEEILLYEQVIRIS